MRSPRVTGLRNVATAIAAVPAVAKRGSLPFGARLNAERWRYFIPHPSSLILHLSSFPLSLDPAGTNHYPPRPIRSSSGRWDAGASSSHRGLFSSTTECKEA